MASMDLDTIIRDLNKRFAAPLPEFYKRRIIFWYDEDREFEDKLDDIQVDNAKLLVLTGTNNFAAKKLLNVDDTTSNYLVYSPISYESQDAEIPLERQDALRQDLCGLSAGKENGHEACADPHLQTGGADRMA